MSINKYIRENIILLLNIRKLMIGSDLSSLFFIFICMSKLKRHNFICNFISNLKFKHDVKGDSYSEHVLKSYAQ